MKVPPEILSIFEEESEGLLYGEVHLTLFLRDGHPRFSVGRSRSIYPPEDGEKREERKP